MFLQGQAMALSLLTVPSHFMLSNYLDLSRKKGTYGGLIISLPCNSFEHWNLRMHGARVQSKRGHRQVVAASPTEATVIPTKPLITKEDLLAYFASGCKPKRQWRYGF